MTYLDRLRSTKSLTNELWPRVFSSNNFKRSLRAKQSQACCRSEILKLLLYHLMSFICLVTLYHNIFLIFFM